jgi:FkbM family methyltransferase
MKIISRNTIAWKLAQIRWMSREGLSVAKIISSFYDRRLKDSLYSEFLYRGKREAEGLGLKFSERMPPGSFHEMFYDEEYNNDEINKILSSYDHPVIFDIGAWYGDSILYFSRKYNAEVFAFEPLPEAFSVAAENVRLNGLTETVHLQNMAISDGYSIQGSTSGNMLSSAGINDETIRFASLRLDDLIASVNHCELLKIDVEGFELNVLKGGKEFIKRFNPCIIVEVHSMKIKDSVLRLLSDGRKVIEGRTKRVYKPKIVGQNLFFIPFIIKHDSNNSK